jgi:hypothetical protein
MNNNFEKTKQLVEQSGNCVNLGRTIAAKYPELDNWIQTETFFLNQKEKVKYTERLYCIINNITSTVTDAFGKEAEFKSIFEGYKLRTNEFTSEIKKQKKLVEKQKKATERETKTKLLKSKTKLEHFVERNKYRNPDLYTDNLVEGYDYVVCPISNARMHKIKNNYITKTLEMQVEDYPDIQRTSIKHIENIKAGVNSIDPITGLTMHEISVAKSRVTLSALGADGKSGYKKKGEKTKNTHLNNIDEHGRNGYQKQVYKRLTTILPNGLTIEKNAHIKQQRVLAARGVTRVVGASMISKKILKPIIEFLDKNSIKYYFDQSEYMITDKDTFAKYFYDLTIPSKNITIEYQSNAWHANPEWDDDRWSSWKPVKGPVYTADDKLKYDYKKAKEIYTQRGFRTHYVWEDSRNIDVERIICLLKT